MFNKNQTPETLSTGTDFDLVTLNGNINGNTHVFSPTNIACTCFAGAFAAVAGMMAANAVTGAITGIAWNISKRRRSKSEMDYYDPFQDEGSNSQTTEETDYTEVNP